MEKIDWSELSFNYTKTKSNVRAYFRNGKWSDLEVSESDRFNMHISATALHYGQQAFEGLKAFRGKDGRIRLFRWQENAKRLQRSARGILMPEVPTELFRQAVFQVIEANHEYVPPYESGASLYLRPMLFGSGPTIGVKPSPEYTFVVFVVPVGPYFKEGFKPVRMLITREFDRAAPLGTGTYKVGGNYAASLASQRKAHELGFANVIYLDAKEKKYIDECGPANFFAIRGNQYITPKSSSILESITNKSLMTLAQELGMEVERRRIPEEELGTFDEVGACGTAAVISPISEIMDHMNQKVFRFCPDGKAGPVSTRLYNRLRAIQYGDSPDPYGWVTVMGFGQTAPSPEQPADESLPSKTVG